MTARAHNYFDELIATKLHPPQPARPLLARSRLVDMLGSRVAHCRLATVIAPAGYGKSTLLAQCCERLTARGIAGVWLSLDAEDDNPYRCLAYITAAIRQLDPVVGERVEAQLSAGGQAPLMSLATTLVHDLARLDGRCTLFLDDFHYLADRETLGLMDWLVAHCPPAMTFVVASRQRPELSTGKLRLDGLLVEIGADQLSFDAGEVRWFMNDIAALDLGAADLDRITERTEGWVAGVQLLSLALQGCENHADFLQAFSGDDRDITDYLGETVLDSQAPATRAFLLRTSILDRMNAGLCEAVSGQPGGQDVLEQIEADNLFVVPLDRHREWFRYHHLFGSFLKNRLARELPGEMPDLYRSAGQWCAANGYKREAIRYAFAARDYDLAGTLIAGLARNLVLYHGEHTTLFDWVDQLPGGSLDRWPEIRLAYAFSLIFARQFARSEKHLQVLERQNSDLRRGPDTIADAIHRDRQSMLEMIRCVMYALNDDSGRCGDAAADWLERWSTAADEYSVAAVNNALAYSTLASFEFETGREACMRAVILADKCRADYARGWTRAMDGMLAMAEGRADQALAIYRQALAVNNESLGPHSYTGSLLATLYAEALYETNDLDGARSQLDGQLPFIDSSSSVEVGYAGYFTLARLQLAEGRPDRASEVLRAGEQKALQYELPRLAVMLVAAQVRFLIANDRPGDARKLAERKGFLGKAAMVFVDDDREVTQGIRAVTRARLCIAQSDTAAALALLKPLMAGAKRHRRERFLVELYLLKARALWHEEKSQPALREFERALHCATAGGLLRPFADEGADVSDMLRRIDDSAMEANAQKAHAAISGFMARLRATCGDGGEARASRGPVSETLTKRELQILRLLDAGSSNRELAETIFVSEQTVKWHLRRIYRKLGVKNRTGAVARARQESLL